MKKIFISGSSSGLGLIAAKELIQNGHSVVLHARNELKAKNILEEINQNVPIVIGDVSDLSTMKDIASKANDLGPYDAIIHNVGIFTNGAEEFTTENLRTLFAVNVLTPYVLSSLIKRPKRMIFLSSGMHLSGKANLEDPQWIKRPWDNTQAYCDSKLFDLMLTLWLSRHWSDSYINAVNPGWVPTRMGGAGAPDDLKLGAHTQVWLSLSDETNAKVTGKYFFHKNLQIVNPIAYNEKSQDELIKYLQKISGLSIP